MENDELKDLKKENRLLRDMVQNLRTEIFSMRKEMSQLPNHESPKSVTDHFPNGTPVNQIYDSSIKTERGIYKQKVDSLVFLFDKFDSAKNARIKAMFDNPNEENRETIA